MDAKLESGNTGADSASEAVTCGYCGGNCPNEPNDSPNLCDGFAGDIDGLYDDEENGKTEDDNT